MTFQVSPGVNFSEVDLTAGITNVSVSDGAFAGPFEWGPALEAQSIGSEGELVSTFGPPDDTIFQYWFSAQAFLAYSNQLFVVRSLSNSALNATVSALSLTGSVDSGNGNTINVNVWSAHANSGFMTSGLMVGQSLIINDGNASHLQNFTVEAIVNGTSFTTYQNPSAVANAASIAAYGLLIANQTVYEANYVPNGVDVGAEGYGAWVAKYPGELGNTLLVSSCDSANAFQSSPNGSISVIAGSNVVTGAATLFQTQTIVGDILVLGSGQQLQITAITNNTQALVSTTALMTATYATTVWYRKWAYANQFTGAPGTSPFAVQRGAMNDEIHVVVVDTAGTFSGTLGAVLERWPFMSKADDALDSNGQDNYYVDIINNGSQYIWWLEAPGVNNTNFGANTLNTTFDVNQLPSTNVLIGGQTQNALVDDAAQETAYDIFQDADLISVSLIITGPASAGLASYIIQNICEPGGSGRGDCVAFVSPLYNDVVNQPGQEVSNIVAFRNSLPSSSYGFLDSGWKYTFDKYNNVNRWVPLNGDIAGVAAASDTQTAPWYSFAGFNRGNIKNVLKLAWNPKQLDRDTLYNNSINPVVAFQGQGTVLYGDKTLLSRPSAFGHINVRRLFIVLEVTISRFAQASLFEFNDAFTQSQFRNAVTPYLRDVEAQRGITDFQVICDSTNNTPNVVNSNSFVGDIYVKPAYSINFIQLNFIAVPTGVSFQEVTGSF